MAAYQTILVDRPEDGIAGLTLNRPESLNAITWEMVEELHDCYSAFEDDLDLRVVILTGAGRGFCSGTDLKAGRDDQDKDQSPDISGLMRRQRRIADLSIRMRKIPQPIIAAVNGVAAGAGCSLALVCDLRIASTYASLIEVFINVALIPDTSSTYTLPRLVGLAKAKELCFTGDKVDAEEALRLGLVNKVVEPDQLMDETRALAKKLAAMPSKGLALTKRLLNQSFENDFNSQLQAESYAQDTAGKTQDHCEGVSAFLEKRKANFTGK